jgi:uncharacterized protein YciI
MDAAMSTIFVAVLTYTRPLEEIDAQLPAHIEWLKQGYFDGIFLASGRRVPRTGGVIIARGDDRETIEARFREDPFHRFGLAEVEIIPFEPSMAAGAFRGLVQDT